MAGARPPDAAAARRFCALPRDLQGSAGRTREGPCGGCGRAGGFAGANGHGRACRSARPWPRVRIVSVHDRRRRAAAAGRAGASPPHIPWPRVRSVPVHGRRGVRSSGRGRARRRDGPALLHPTSRGRVCRSARPSPRVRGAPVHDRRGRARRLNLYRAQGGFAPTAAVRRRRAPLRSRSAPRAGRGPRGRSGRRPRSAGRWGGAGRASR